MLTDRLYAHSLVDAPPAQWQLLDVHLENVSRMAGEFASAFNAREWATTLGAYHDLGKSADEFQAYLLKENGIELPASMRGYHQGRVTHAMQGGRLLHSQRPDGPAKGVAKLLSYCLTGHHRGLPNATGGQSSLHAYLRTPYENGLLPEIKSVPSWVGKLSYPSGLPISLAKGEEGFQLAFLVRMLFSCLVDADFLDTEAFMDHAKSQRRGGCPELPGLHSRFFEKVDAMLAGTPDSELNRSRREMYEHCLDASQDDQGLFSLSMPTGGGKTLASMAFALSHAKKHNLSRIIYVIPFTSIIEQNAQVFREFLGADAVLEHHCHVAPREGDLHSPLASENWDAPVVVTTNVQFFDSLMANRTSKTRKLHRLADSVIVFDEAQSLPVEHLQPCMAAIQELSRNYGASAVLCTATQPALNRTEEFEKGLIGVREIIPEPQHYFDQLKRVNISVRTESTLDETLIDELRQHPRVLTIVNTRKHARILFEGLRDLPDTYHLSALMCPAHRKEMLTEIREALVEGGPCRVVSTQLIEAGVDVDFPVVYRALAGVDSIAQAAGRCNREGKLDGLGEVIVFEPEHRQPPGAFRRAADGTRETMVFHEDLLSPPAVEDYFRRFYWQASNMDKCDIMALCDPGKANGDFPFEEMASFSLIDSPTRGVIIPHDSQASALAEKVRRGFANRNDYRKLQGYMVQVYPKTFEALGDNGLLERIEDDLFLLIDSTMYDLQTGLKTGDELKRSPENCVF